MNRASDAPEETGGGNMNNTANGGSEAAGSSTGRQASQKQVEKVVLQYLKSKGYKNAEKALREDATMDGMETTLGDLASAFPANEMGSDASVPEWVMFYSEAEQGNPDAYSQSYRELRRWIDSSLDIYKHELYAVSYPIFVHAFLDLHMRGLHEKAAEFMELYSRDHVVHHGKDIEVLSTLTCKAHVEENALAKLYRENKYGVRMTRVGFELLLSFLQDHHFTLLMRTVNQYLNIRTIDGTEPISSEPEADVGITGHTQNQLDQFNSQEIALGSAPLDPFVRDEVERTLQSEAGRPAKDEASNEATELLDTFSKVKQENAASALSARDAIPMPPPRGVEIEQQIANLKALRKRVVLGPAALPSVCMYTLHNTDNTMNCATVSEDLSLMACGFSESYIKIWSLKHEPLRGFQSNFHPSQVNSEQDAEALREKTSDETRKLVGHSGPVFGVDISFDSKYLMSCSEDKTARLWSLDTMTNVVCYKGHNYPIWDVSFAPQGFYFATASHDRTARLWSCDHIYALRIFAGHLSDVNCVRFHPNSKYVVTGSCDKTVRLWDVQRGSCVRVFTGHTGSVDTVAISPDGRIMASAGEDQTVNVWDLGSGRRMESLTGHTGPVYSLAFSQEGTLLLSGAADETVRSWDIKRSPTASDHPIIAQRRDQSQQQDQLNSTDPDAMVIDSETKPGGKNVASDSAAKSNGKQPESKKRDAAGMWKSKRVVESEALLKTWRTKSTPIYNVMMTKRNLAVAIGAFTP
ncbi:Transcription initiation factor TFIID subunit 5 [Coemansia sp. RSA 989]|nr:WD40-repeat-containing domain protein [Coemansia mojavensis]KAJ1742997.1 Transcription initiation factor TFIID subunit 5 [Coemansia sp. RSA 1086]KAJ1752284.1 Transcription initiation factor TFIID subunit 5 [Coemansia sp. RSA 1821]KAJ1866740.1 Transcription initiation factor TFIID subunit 5 [Coemansia sp. RSA 989]KAJ1873599.1 Transcription initiation factor TFIID subunit 5 [Coemansia sp. RSA 990]KAJ2631331.1 Transcription initiation factor TFIID subunit 5 [Coemansia sp. RSA 1290]KAJ2648746.